MTQRKQRANGNNSYEKNVILINNEKKIIRVYCWGNKPVQRTTSYQIITLTHRGAKKKTEPEAVRWDKKSIWKIVKISMSAATSADVGRVASPQVNRQTDIADRRTGHTCIWAVM